MAGLKNIFPIDWVFAIKKSLLKSVAYTNGWHFLVKDLFDDKSDKNNNGQDDATYDDKFHGL
jgi:hypothetical protein